MWRHFFNVTVMDSNKLVKIPILYFIVLYRGTVRSRRNQSAPRLLGVVLIDFPTRRLRSIYRRDSTNPFFIFFSFKYNINVIIQIKGIISKEILFFVFYTKIRAFYIKETNIGSGIFTIYKIGFV